MTGDIDGVRVGVDPNLGEDETVERGVVLGSATTVDSVGLKRVLKMVVRTEYAMQDSRCQMPIARIKHLAHTYPNAIK